MFGFGDDQNPYTESVDLLEDLVIEFITEMVWKKCSHIVAKFMSPSFICTYLTQHKQNSLKS